MSDTSAPVTSSPVTRDELVDHLATGILLDLGNRDETGRVITGPLLREVLINRDLDRDPRGLYVRGARIPDDLNLSYCTVPAPLRLRGTKFKGVLRLQGATIIGRLDLTKSELRGTSPTGEAMHADRLHVNGNISLVDVKSAEGAIQLRNAIITGNLDLSGAELNGKNDRGEALAADGIQVDAGAFLTGLKVQKGAVRLTGASITSKLDLSDAELNGIDKYRTALAANGLRVDGNASLMRCKVAEGAIALSRATVTGYLNLMEAVLRGQDARGNALAADGLRVDGNALMNGLKVAEGGAIWLARANITGELNLTGAELNGKNKGGHALAAYGMLVDGDATLTRMEVSGGPLTLSRATITGFLNLTETVLHGQDSDGDALVADGLRVEGGAFLKGLTVTEGAIWLPRANITGALDLSGAELKGKNKMGYALLADGMQVNGHALVNRLTVPEGAIRLVDANITGLLNLTETVLKGHDRYGNALVADGLQVGGGGRMMQLKITQGAIRLRNATITTELDLSDAELNGKNNNDAAVDADGLRVEGNADLSRMTVEGGAVRLRGATITNLRLNNAELNGKDQTADALAANGLQVKGDASLESLKVAEGAAINIRGGRIGTMILENNLPRSGWRRHNFLGLQYDQIRGGPAKSARQGTRLLANQGRGPDAAQPYWQLAEYYARVGNDSAARRIRFWSNVLQTRAHPRSLARFFYGLTTGFGYYPFLALLWLAVLIGIDSALVDHNHDAFIPAKAAITSSVPAAKTSEPISSSTCDPRYPCFNSILYATDTVVPVISLGQQDAWRIDTSRPESGLQVTLLATKAGGWILTTLLVGGVGGLLRRP